MTRQGILTSLIFFLMVTFWAGSGLAQEPILVGVPLPLTGPYASDGEQMKMALEMAVAEYKPHGCNL